MWNFQNLLSLEYYINNNPAGDFMPGFFLLGFFAFLVFLPGFLKNIAKGNKYLKKSLKKRLWFFPILGVIGGFLVLTRFAEVPGFSMRIWLYIVLDISIIVTIYTLFKIRGSYKKRLASVEREKNK